MVVLEVLVEWGKMVNQELLVNPEVLVVEDKEVLVVKEEAVE